VLQVTKVWINCVIRVGEQVVGILGSGIDLTFFVREVVDVPQTGVTAMFVDRSGALQAHRDPRLVDFHSLTKQIDERKTIFALIDRLEDQQTLAALMQDVTAGEVLVKSAFMQVGGRQTLVGVGYLDQLGWYNVTFMDVDKIIDRGLFLPIGLLLAAIMLSATLLIGLVFKRSVLDRLALVERRFAGITAGNFTPFQPDESKDEIGRLSRAFASMAVAIGTNRQVLERMVQERTEELEILAYLDQLTQIANRRGFIDGFAEVQQRAQTAGTTVGLLLVDIDRFKEINDKHGHLAGDQVVAEAARRLTKVLQAGDICGRWGGDEFVALIHDIGSKGLHGMAEAARRAVCELPIPLVNGSSLSITVSVGACLVEPGVSVDVAADMADAALYRAKTEGRDRAVIFDAEHTSSTQAVRAEDSDRDRVLPEPA
jgi:diguanylate cyclase (GGDEF)-like protein